MVTGGTPSPWDSHCWGVQDQPLDQASLPLRFCLSSSLTLWAWALPLHRLSEAFTRTDVQPQPAVEAL